MATTEQLQQQIELRDGEIRSLKQHLEETTKARDALMATDEQRADEHTQTRRDVSVLDGALAQLVGEGDSLAMTIAGLGSHLDAVERVVADMRRGLTDAGGRLDQHARVRDEVRRLRDARR